VKNILSRRSRSLLQEFAGSNVLIALDFDGTLAPIVKVRNSARMRASTRALLSRLTRFYPSAILSGRAYPDIAAKIGLVPVSTIVGNHGLEWPKQTPTMSRVQALVSQWREELDSELANVRGVEIEDKRFTLSVHYRNCPNPDVARRKIARALRKLTGARVQAGKMVFNLLPMNLGDKGSALQQLMQKLGCERAIYVGDDVTDEDVFLLKNPNRLLTVRVGKSKASRADYYLEDQGAIDDLLEELNRLRWELSLSA
jgi:trehalose 6-phosphate phosphatase